MEVSSRISLMLSGSLVAAILAACSTAGGNRSVIADAVSPPTGAASSTREGELPSWQIPHLGSAAEAYYAPDNLHLIAQVQSPLAVKSPRGADGYLTQTFTDAGTDIVQVNDKGWDACSFFFPDGKRVVWTSIKDHPDLPVGRWSDWRNYPRGAELYISDLKGGNVQRLTNNTHYEAEVTVSPNGRWIVFGRMIGQNMDLWIMNADGTGERQITFTEDDQEGAPYFLPDNETILFRAWKASTYDRKPTPMTIYTIKRDGTGLQAQTHDDTMNWAPYPAPDGKHYVFVRTEPNDNWEVYLGKLDSRDPPRRLTFSEGFDGFPSLSPDGRKMVWTSSRSNPGAGPFQGLRLHVMDVSSLKLGPASR